MHAGVWIGTSPARPPAWPFGPAFRQPKIVRREPPLIEQERPAGARPGYDGRYTCGPTVMTMIARVIGYGTRSSEGELIDRFSEIGATTKAGGTEISGMLAIGRAMKQRIEVIAGGDLGWLADRLREGAFVIANGEYYAMAPHANPAKREGHFVLVYGIDGRGRFLVRDPDDPRVHAVEPDDLRRFFREHRNGGFQIAVSSAAILAAREKVLLRRFSAPRPARAVLRARRVRVLGSEQIPKRRPARASDRAAPDRLAA